MTRMDGGRDFETDGADRFWKSHGSRRPWPRRLHDVGLTCLGASMALAVFAVDTFTPIESAIAVLYVVALLVSSDALSRRGIITATSACFGLCLLSYLIQHGLGDDLQTVLRLLVSLSALTITAALLLKNDAARRQLLQSHEEVARGEYRYRSIFEGARVAIWEQDHSRLAAFLKTLKADGVTNLHDYAAAHSDFIARCASMIETVAVNHAAVELLQATSTTELLGPLGRFIPPDDGQFLEIVKVLFDGGMHFEAKGSVRTLDGRVRSVLTILEYPQDESALGRVIVALVDITEREQTHAALLAAQMELARASRVSAVGVASASIAHELHQPLGALTVNAETCLRWLDKLPPNLPAARKAVERMVSDAERASAIVRNTRALVTSRPSSPGIVDAVGLVRETAELMDHQIRQAGATPRLTVPEEKLPVAIARNELQQVLINLIGNAVQAMAEAGSSPRLVNVCVTRLGTESVEIDVADTGPGIAEAHMRQLFDAFFTTRPDGMGMGLAISRSAVEACGGRLTAANNACRNGTSTGGRSADDRYGHDRDADDAPRAAGAHFTVWLPLAQAAADSAPQRDGMAAMPHGEDESNA